MQIRNIAGYKFINLSNLAELRSRLLEQCQPLQLKGTILISPEGINVSLAGLLSDIDIFETKLKENANFTDMTFRKSYSETRPFKRLKVKIRKEIITLRLPEIRPEIVRAPSISPLKLKQWLDEKRDFTLLDTRNDYEIRFGSFSNATNLHMHDFCEFPKVAANLTLTKPIVMFCTGGIRCEKASLHLLNEKFSEVYQLDGGILNYFAEVGGAHYEGECFVFDERIAVNSKLQTTGTLPCPTCQGPSKRSESNSSNDNSALLCQTCINNLT